VHAVHSVRKTKGHRDSPWQLNDGESKKETPDVPAPLARAYAASPFDGNAKTNWKNLKTKSENPKTKWKNHKEWRDNSKRYRHIANGLALIAVG
jgi:hypothetical protein